MTHHTERLGMTRRFRPDHRGGIEFAAIDAHRAAEAAADLERGLPCGCKPSASLRPTSSRGNGSGMARNNKEMALASVVVSDADLDDLMLHYLTAGSSSPSERHL
jgi:hypothetical protein